MPDESRERSWRMAREGEKLRIIDRQRRRFYVSFGELEL
jgi:hypothetical protein